MIRNTDIEDTYKGGQFLRQWSDRVNEPDAETPKTVTQPDMDGNESTEAHPEWAAYDASQATEESSE